MGRILGVMYESEIELERNNLNAFHKARYKSDHFGQSDDYIRTVKDRHGSGIALIRDDRKLICI